MSIFTGTADAAVIWSEDFEAGLGDWTIIGYNETTLLPMAGNFSDSGGVLTALDDDANKASRNSTTTVGTWSFDMFVPHNSDGVGTIDVMFMSNGTRPFPQYSSLTVSFEAWYDHNRFDLWELRGNFEGNLLDQYTPTGGIEGWWHVDVSRSNTGRFRVFLNDTPIMDIVNNDVTSSDYFEFFCWNAPGAALDNIVVDDVVKTQEVTTTPTTTTPPPEIPYLLITVGAGVVVVIVLAIVFLRRR